MTIGFMRWDQASLARANARDEVPGAPLLRRDERVDIASPDRSGIGAHFAPLEELRERSASVTRQRNDGIERHASESDRLLEPDGEGYVRNAYYPAAERAGSMFGAELPRVADHQLHDSAE